MSVSHRSQYRMYKKCNLLSARARIAAATAVSTSTSGGSRLGASAVSRHLDSVWWAGRGSSGDSSKLCLMGCDENVM